MVRTDDVHGLPSVTGSRLAIRLRTLATDRRYKESSLAQNYQDPP
jgi:hypothetical protein